MKFLLVTLAVLCGIACIAEAQRSRGFPGHVTARQFPPLKLPRFRRDAPEEPQGSVVLQGRQPLSGPDRQPTLDLNYQHRIIDNDRTKLDAFGGANLHRGHVSPQAGFGVEHRFKNDIFVRGQGQVEQGPRGRLSPSFGAGVGWRFRRDAPEESTFGRQGSRGFPGQIPPRQFPPLKLPRFRRDAPEEPQGSVVLQGRQPLSGPDRQPTLDLNYQHRIIDNDRTKLDAFGGANLHRGHVSPQAGFGVEHRFKNDIFVRGQGQVEQGPRGRLSPSFGAGVGWRFRRDAPEESTFGRQGSRGFPGQIPPRQFPPLKLPRFRRDAPEEPQGSVVLQGRQPLSGPDRQPTLDLNYQHRIIDNDRTKLDAFGGANLHRGHVSPQAGFGVEHRFKNDIFVRGQGQVEQGPRGRLSPSFGAGVGWRFRRETLPYEAEEVFEQES